MKKLLTVVVCLLIIVVCAYVAMRLTTANKAKEIITEFMEEMEEKEWNYKSAYLDPFFQSLHINDFSVNDGSQTVFAKTVRIYHYKKNEITASASITLKDLAVTNYNNTVIVDKIDIKGLVLDLKAMETLLAKGDEYPNPFAELKSIDVAGVKVLDFNDRLVASIKAAGFHGPIVKGVVPGKHSYFAHDIVFSNISYIEGIRKEYTITNADLKAVCNEKTDTCDAVFDMDAKDLFALKVPFKLENIIQMAIQTDIMDMRESVGFVRLVNGELTYTDKSFIDHMFDLAGHQSGSSKTEILEMFSSSKGLLSSKVENGDVFMDLLIGFFEKPSKLQIKTNLEKPVELATAFQGEGINNLHLVVIFNGTGEFLLQFIESYYYDDYYDDYYYGDEEEYYDDGGYDDEYDGSHDESYGDGYDMQVEEIGE